MDFEQLCLDYRLDYKTQGHKHCRPGWVNVPCPFCTGNPGYHLGYDTEAQYFKCWRCGYHSQYQTVSTLLNVQGGDVSRILKEYGGFSFRTKSLVTPKISIFPFKYPSKTKPLTNRHKNYLIRRGFDPEELIELWDIQSTSSRSELDNIEYYDRILIPISWDGDIVSFQGRAINANISVKYRACPRAREKINHQRILYGNQDHWKDGVGICVEGVTDVWKLGPKAFAVFGIDYTHSQVREIAKRFHTVGVLFDSDPQAIKQAEKLVGELRFRGVRAIQYFIEGDPGDLSLDDATDLADWIIKDLKDGEAT